MLGKAGEVPSDGAAVTHHGLGWVWISFDFQHSVWLHGERRWNSNVVSSPHRSRALLSLILLPH